VELAVHLILRILQEIVERVALHPSLQKHLVVITGHTAVEIALNLGNRLGSNARNQMNIVVTGDVGTGIPIPGASKESIGVVDVNGGPIDGPGVFVIGKPQLVVTDGVVGVKLIVLDGYRRVLPAAVEDSSGHGVAAAEPRGAQKWRPGSVIQLILQV
jgi:hypothetical protein